MAAGSTGASAGDRPGRLLQYKKDLDVALSDVNGDGHEDILLSYLRDSAVVRAFDGAALKQYTPLAQIGEYKPMWDTYGGGLYIATHDLNGDGKRDLLFKQQPDAAELLEHLVRVRQVRADVHTDAVLVRGTGAPQAEWSDRLTAHVCIPRVVSARDAHGITPTHWHSLLAFCECPRAPVDAAELIYGTHSNQGHHTHADIRIAGRPLVARTHHPGARRARRL
jgi:hypothetical protein